jgi:hypothetical protein
LVETSSGESVAGNGDAIGPKGFETLVLEVIA